MIDPVVVQFWTLIFDEVKRRQEAGEPADYASIMQSLFGLCTGVWQKIPDLRGIDYTDSEVESWIWQSVKRYKKRPDVRDLFPVSLVGEEWRKLEGYPDYPVSNLGRVWSVKTGKFLKPSNKRGGKKKRKVRPGVTLTSEDGRQHAFTIARLVATAFIPNPDNLPEVDHINEDTTDNRVVNLRWITGEDNRQAYMERHLREDEQLD